MTLKILSILMVLIGAAVLFLSFSPAIKISRNLVGLVRRKWVIILNLMGFFIIGYLSFDIILISNLSFPPELITGGVFLGGAVFVFIVMNVSLNTIEALQKAEEAIHVAKDDWESTFYAVTDMITVHDMDFNIIRANPAAREIFGLKQQEGIYLGKCFRCYHGTENPPLGCMSCQSLRTGKTSASEVFEPHLNKFLEIRAMPRYANNGRLIGLIHVVRDITERKQAEEAKAKLEVQLQQAQKFEAIGTLAGGIAHDFNNLLMGIQGRVSLLSFDFENSHPLWEHINALEEYIRSATSLTRQLLGFARGGKYEVKPIDLNELVLNSSAMFGRTKKEIQIHTKCQTSAQVVEADKGQIEQVLLNMYVNAWQAMHNDEGHLYLETKIVTLDDANCKPHHVKPGRYVKISITDTGIGMDEATRLRIFDPFFTTKEMGRGTGLGLASAYGIIKNHGGMITVYSEIDHGTTFNIYLPLSNKEAHREAPMITEPIKGSATVLLVDDEEMIIDVGQAILERLGYRVVVCRDGQEAVKVISDMGNKIDMVILDMIMPRMDGGTTFDRIREIQPDMPVILSSGYAFNGNADKIMRRGCSGFIQKPYNISELSQKIVKVLDESKGLTVDLLSKTEVFTVQFS